jgi:hypothetical protein
MRNKGCGYDFVDRLAANGERERERGREREREREGESGVCMYVRMCVCVIERGRVACV